MSSDIHAYFNEPGHLKEPKTCLALSEGQRVGMDQIRAAADSMIRSISGWRGCMSVDGRKESRDTRLNPAFAILATAAALSFVRLLRSTGKPERILLACDTRATGPAIVDTLLRSYTYLGIQADLAGVVSAPEAAAAVASDSRIGGLCYVTASHNPQGYNGFKFINELGLVLGAANAAELNSMFESTIGRWDAFEKLRRIVLHADARTVSAAYADQSSVRRRCRDAYVTLLKERLSRPWTFHEIQSHTHPVAVFADMNGSARSLGPDDSFLSSWGMDFRSINDNAGEIVHSIEPEGEALNECRSKMGSALIGYVPDNDGDRGNLVLNPGDGTPFSLSGQDVFALSVVAELAMDSVRAFRETHEAKRAVVVNGPTSLRINRIARAFGAEVFRAEVGEANVIERARLLREQGYIIPITGEGSNGGNITHPGTIRDPLSTVCSILRLIAWKPPQQIAEVSPALAAFRALRISEDPASLTPKEILSTVLRSLPSFRTTLTADPTAKVTLESVEHAKLKAAYERLVSDEIEKLKRRPELVWVSAYRILNFEGTEEREGAGNRDPEGNQSGGLAVHLLDTSGEARAFVWFRGSRTEPVLRIIVDLEDTNETAYSALLQMQTELIADAARLARDGGIF